MTGVRTCLPQARSTHDSVVKNGDGIMVGGVCRQFDHCQQLLIIIVVIVVLFVFIRDG